MLLSTEEPITKQNMNADWHDMNHSLHSKQIARAKNEPSVFPSSHLAA